MDDEVPVPKMLALPGKDNLGLGRHWHFFAIIFWVLNGVIYWILLFATGEWTTLIPILVDHPTGLADLSHLHHFSYSTGQRLQAPRPAAAIDVRSGRFPARAAHASHRGSDVAID